MSVRYWREGLLHCFMVFSTY